MKNIVTALAIALFSIGMNVNAQEAKPKATTKTESTAKVKKTCTKDHKTCTAEEKKTCDKTKRSCCAAKTEKKA
jgi:hypothetical protein